mmetsp:Transcript_9469/g.35229  ORF Transcript_9469/g.35229 Transcript_9469/m.35229 type:complete len:204 (+) Transcript_9469:988-1599(+)
MEASQAGPEVSRHNAGDITPESHVLGPVTAWPALHVGWHVSPESRYSGQSPTPPSDGGVDDAHCELQIAAAKTPFASHELLPETVKPTSHVSEHSAPRSRKAVQSPTSPFSGATEASQLIRCHAPGGPALRSVEASYVPVHVPRSNEVSYPQLLYFAFHAVASLNISSTDSEWFPPKVQPVMSLSKASAPWNMLDSDDQPYMQ